MKIGLIDVGGGSRDIYGAGILDFCLEAKVNFDYCIGISAGSANIASFLAKQKGRNYKFYTEYFFRKDYASFKNLILKKNYVDLDYVYGTLSNSDGEYPLDFEAMQKNPAIFKLQACQAITAQPYYFDKKDLKPDHFSAFKASSCLPLICQPVVIWQKQFFDGGLIDPIPLQKAFADGCDKVVLILTRPKEERRNSKRDAKCAKLLAKSYPNVAKALEKRYLVYNEQLEMAKKYEKEGQVLILAPDDILGLRTLTKDRKKLDLLYQKGLADGRKILSFLKDKY